MESKLKTKKSLFFPLLSFISLKQKNTVHSPSRDFLVPVVRVLMFPAVKLTIVEFLLLEHKYVLHDYFYFVRILPKRKHNPNLLIPSDLPPGRMSSYTTPKFHVLRVSNINPRQNADVGPAYPIQNTQLKSPASHSEKPHQ